MNYESLSVSLRNQERIEEAAKKLSHVFQRNIDDIRTMILGRIHVCPPVQQCREAIERVRTELEHLQGHTDES